MESLKSNLYCTFRVLTNQGQMRKNEIFASIVSFSLCKGSARKMVENKQEWHEVVFGKTTCKYISYFTPVENTQKDGCFFLAISPYLRSSRISPCPAKYVWVKCWLLPISVDLVVFVLVWFLFFFNLVVNGLLLQPSWETRVWITVWENHLMHSSESIL